jgi:hypothetical protein
MNKNKVMHFLDLIQLRSCSGNPFSHLDYAGLRKILTCTQSTGEIYIILDSISHSKVILTTLRLTSTRIGICKYTFLDVTVHCEMVSNRRVKHTMFFAWQERGEAKFHHLSHPKGKHLQQLPPSKKAAVHLPAEDLGCRLPVH